LGLAFCFKKRYTKKEQLNGIKTLILSVALPATIFIALLKIELKASLLMLPILALSFNVIMFLAVKYLLPFFIKFQNKPQQRTLQMLLPSLAPGLSCFPFIVAYLGEDYLAHAALADVGNKVFGLIILYLLAMYWHHKIVENKVKNPEGKLKKLFLSLINEPINVVIFMALLLLAFGLNFNHLPMFIQNTIGSLKVIMVPLVLLFIGMAVKIKYSEFKYIFKILLWRAGFTFILAALFLFLAPNMAASATLLLVVFPLSSSSFWPFAHMNVVQAQMGKSNKSKIFDLDFAISVLACSLPFSTLTIISVFYFKDTFSEPLNVLWVGLALLVCSIFPKIFYHLKSVFKRLGLLNKKGHSFNYGPSE
jgi:predicted permease